MPGSFGRNFMHLNLHDGIIRGERLVSLGNGYSRNGKRDNKQLSFGFYGSPSSLQFLSLSFSRGFHLLPFVGVSIHSDNDTKRT